jgi:hypothetical protein
MFSQAMFSSGKEIQGPNQSVTLLQLRFAAIVMVNFRKDFHLQGIRHAGRTKKGLPHLPDEEALVYLAFPRGHAHHRGAVIRRTAVGQAVTARLTGIASDINSASR